MLQKLKRKLFVARNRIKPKVFCIGKNKTGTTSLKVLFKQLNYTVALQRPAELLFDNWKIGDFDSIIKFAADEGSVFQDIPFSLPETYKHLYNAFPKSKFILTVRDSGEDWYDSLIRYHSKMFGNGSIPTVQDLKNSTYCRKGWVWEVHSHLRNIDTDDLYNKESLIQSYLNHNSAVKEFFQNKKSNLLEINLADTDAPKRLSQFLGLKNELTKIPWENKTK